MPIQDFRLALMSLIPASLSSFQPSTHCGNARSNWTTYIQAAWLEYTCLSVVAALTLSLYCTPMYYKERHVVPVLPQSLRLTHLGILKVINYQWE
jgi:hypothetical protein